MNVPTHSQKQLQPEHEQQPERPRAAERLDSPQRLDSFISGALEPRWNTTSRQLSTTAWYGWAWDIQGTKVGPNEQALVHQRTQESPWLCVRFLPS